MKIIKKSFAKPDDPIYKEGFKTFTPNKHNKKKVELKLPIELVTSLRDKGAGAVACIASSLVFNIRLFNCCRW